jgi:cold shock CspA family protein
MAAGTPYLDFGLLKSFDSHGFGFVHSFVMDRDVWFHISAVTDRKLRACIDQRQQFEDLRLWWLVELVPQRWDPNQRKFQAVTIWQSLEETAAAYRGTFVKRAVSCLNNSADLSPERLEIFKHLLRMPELDRREAAKVLSSRSICANPHKIIHLLTPEQRADLRPHFETACPLARHRTNTARLA